MMFRYLKNNLGWILVWVLASLPILIWLLMKPLSLRFENSSLIFRSLGQLAGLLGMALLSLNFILAARFKFLDRWFNGLNRVYQKHHLVGGLAFGLLLFHPTFLILQFLLVSLSAAFNFTFLFGSWPLFFGKLALLIFAGLLVITFYLNFKYNVWKNTHQYLGLVLFLGGIHMLFIPSDISNNALLKFYMVTLALLGAISYAYRVLFSIYRKREFRYELKEVKKIKENVFELKLSPLGPKMSFLPGQFVFLRFETGGPLAESHPFSIASSPADQYLSLGIKNLGDYTAQIQNLKPGLICRLEGPFGVFSYSKGFAKNQIWVAGGIGITPFLGMARDIAKSKNDYKIDIFHSIKNASEAAFGDELSQLAAQNANIHYYEHLSEQKGFISADLISQKIANLKGAEVFLCGPTGFMKSLKEQFINLGLTRAQIHSEEFSL